MTSQPIPLEISCQAVAERQKSGDDFLLLDCRERAEYEQVHIEGTMLLPLSELRQRAAELQPYRDRSIVVYCHLGGRSLQLAEWLRQQGFGAAQSMAGGIEQWAVEIEPGMARY